MIKVLVSKRVVLWGFNVLVFVLEGSTRGIDKISILMCWFIVIDLRFIVIDLSLIICLDILVYCIRVLIESIYLIEMMIRILIWVWLMRIIYNFVDNSLFFILLLIWLSLIMGMDDIGRMEWSKGLESHLLFS